MTSMYEAQKGIIEEVKDRILALAPEYEESVRFSVRDEFDRSLSDIEEDTGRARLFEISEGQYKEPTYIGASTRGFRYVHQIEIMYPNDETWLFGANSDAELIRNDLINNSNSISGVQQRHLVPNTEPLIEKDADDPWVKMTLDLVVYYEIS